MRLEDLQASEARVYSDEGRSGIAHWACAAGFASV